MEWVTLHGGTHHGYFLPAEGASDNALALFSFHSLAAYEQGTVLLVCSEAVEAEQRECVVAGALGWQEVAMVSATVQSDPFHPALGKACEGVDLGRINHLLNGT